MSRRCGPSSSPHQANTRIIETAAKAESAAGKFYLNVERTGNTSAASIPIALCEAVEEGRLKPDDKSSWSASAVVDLGRVGDRCDAATGVVYQPRAAASALRDGGAPFPPAPAEPPRRSRCRALPNGHKPGDES
jgi:hypothetical protein